MTLERSGTGTASYQASGRAPGRDVFGFSSPVDYSRKQLPPAHFETFPIPGKPNKVGWRFIVYNLQGGVNTVEGWLLDAHTKMKRSSADSRWEDQAILPQLMVAQTSPGINTSADGIINRLSSANVFGTLVIAASGQMFKETSATNPALTELTLSPTTTPATILSTSVVQIGGALAGEPRLAVGFFDDPVMIYGNVGATPTEDGAMHANTVLCCGIVQTTIDDDLLLIMANEKLYALPSSSAIATAPTLVRDNVPYGGGPLGLQQLGGAPLRVFWLWTRSSMSTSNALIFPIVDWRKSRARIVHTNQRGEDPQELKFPIPWVNYGGVIRDGIVGGNESRIFFHNARGYRFKDLRLLSNWEPDSDRKRYIQGIHIKDDELYAVVDDVPSDFTGFAATGATIRREFHYIWEYDTWQQVSSDETLDVTNKGLMTAGAIGSLPVSDQTGYLHSWLSYEEEWRRQYQPPPGTNPFSLRQTTGAGATTGSQYEASGVIQMPDLKFPSYLAATNKRITAVGSLGNLDAGGSGSYCTFEGGRVKHQFVYGYGKSHQWKDFKESERQDFTTLAPKFTFARGSSAYMTPQILPVVIEGEADLDHLPGIRVTA